MIFFTKNKKLSRSKLNDNNMCHFLLKAYL